MDIQNVTDYTNIATRAILEALTSNQEPSEYTKKAVYHAMDDGFRDIINAVAEGMGLSVVRIDRNVGVLLVVQDANSPFAPGLSWVSKKLSINNKNNRQELQGVAMLVLVSLLAVAFPKLQTTSLDWSSPTQFTAQDILNKLNQVADDIVSRHKADTNSRESTLLTFARVISEGRIPKDPSEGITGRSATRSQNDLVVKWIDLLADQGLLIKDQGYQDEEEYWMASEKFRVYIGQAATEPLIEMVLAIKNQSEIYIK